MIFLISDLLWWLLVIAFIYAMFRICGDPLLKQQWLNVINQPLAMVCLCVLAFFALLTGLDSLHFKTDNGNVVSVLGQILKPISSQLEQSYSEPFAAYAMNKVNVMQDGVMTRQHPRLIHSAVGVELADYSDTTALGSEVVGDILKKLLMGMMIGVMLSALMAAALHQLLPKSPTWYTRRTCLCTLAVMIMLLTSLYWLSLHYHVLGTDKVGNDVFVSALKGTRTAVLIGSLTTIVLLPLALITGLSAGYFRGLVDDVIQYVYTTLNSIPGILLIASAVLMLQVFIDLNEAFFSMSVQHSDARLVLLCAILGLTSWTGLCRLLRAEALKLRSADYVQAAHAFGLSHSQILSRHILPNVTHIVLIVVVLDFSGLVLAEAVLAYVGVGVDPTMPSWGNMINNARVEIAMQPPVWWNVFAVFTLMFSLVLAANLFADAVKKEFDPRTKSHIPKAT